MSRWTLLTTFAPVPEQGWEEQNEGEDFASRVLAVVKKSWDYDDEVSNDFRGEGFDGSTYWTLSEDRTQLWLYADVLDQLETAIDSVLKWTIPLTMVLLRDDAWPDDGLLMVEEP